jgi:hypothetical protein
MKKKNFRIIDKPTLTEMRYWKYRGMSNKQIQREFGLGSRKTVTRICGSGIETKIKITEKEQAAIRDEFLSGATKLDISKNGYSTSVIDRLCEKLSQSPRPKEQAPTHGRNLEIWERRKSGETFKSIGASFDITSERARQIFLKFEKKSQQ